MTNLRSAFVLSRPARLPSRRLLMVLALVGVAAGGGLGGWWLWHRQPAREPPAVELAGVDPAVATAIETARAKVRQSPHSAAAWGLLGEVLVAHDFRAVALTCFAEAERLGPREPRWPYYQGVALYLGDPDAALPKLRRAVELCGDAPAAPRLLLAEALLNQGNLDEAESHYRHLLGRDLRNPWARLGLARVAAARDRPQDGLADLRQAAASRSCAKAAQTLLAQVLQRLGNEEEAAVALRRAADLPDDSGWPDPFVEAIEELQIGERASLKRAGRLINQDRVAEGVRLLRQTTRDYPQSYGAWLMLGQGLLKGQDFADAEQALRQAVRLAPTPVDARYFLGVALLERGENRAAADCFREATKLKPDHALAYYQLGRCLVRLEDRTAALGAFHDAVRCKPDFADAHAELGELLLRDRGSRIEDRGSRIEGLEHLRLAIELNPMLSKARKLLDEAGRED
jgi:cytochrome c-type biogenesis protein CcmH/NrfG